MRRALDAKSFTQPRWPLALFDERFRASSVEHALLLNSFGEIVVFHTGSNDEVKFTLSELARACAGTLIHNHPRCLPPSMNDLTIAAKYGLSLRAICATPEGDHIDYVVQMAAPSEQLANDIRQRFDDEVERAEVELASHQLIDRQWERESRHLAVSRLAATLGFTYQRLIGARPVAEMSAHSVNEDRLDLIASVSDVISKDVFTPAYHRLTSLLARNSNVRGIIPIERLPAVRQEANLIITHAMLGSPTQAGLLSPYKVHHEGNIVPDSPYFAALWKLIKQAAQLAINQHASMMRDLLPADLLRHFEAATINPFNSIVSEMDDNIPEPVFDVQRRWAGDKTLSDRIWIATGDMRRKLDNYVTTAIASGRSVHDMSRELQEFMLPGNGTFEAMRLARTEVAAAYSQADFAAAQLNPFVDSYSPFTVPQHQCCDNCDDEEAGGPYPKSDSSHLPPFHAHCLCGVRWNRTTNPAAIIDSLRWKIAQGISSAARSVADFVGPLSKRFINFMFGEK